MVTATPHNSSSPTAPTSGKGATSARKTAQRKNAANDASKRNQRAPSATGTGTSKKSKSAPEHPRETPTQSNGPVGRPRAALQASSLVNHSASAPLNSDQTDMDVDVEDPAAEVARLKAELAEAHEQIKATKAAAATIQQEPVETIHELKKPKGEAGDKKRGFVLREAMGLEDDAAMYKEILARVKTNAIKAGIDFKRKYKNQKKETLGKVFKASRTTMPNDTDCEKELAAYLMRKRFPVDWAQAEIVKQFIRNNRKHARKNGRLPKAGSDDDVGDQEEEGIPNVDIDDTD